MPDWDALVREHGPAVLRIAVRILGGLPDAEDVTQDVFCEAWQIQASQQVANWPGLLRRLAVLRSLDKLRRRRSHAPLTEDHLVDTAEAPHDRMLARELADRLRGCLCQLPEQQAAVFSLFYFEHLNREEIATTLGTTVGAVSTAHSKARRNLKTALTETLQEPNCDQR
ncbi:ECF RNA polymerase sigma factor SigE [Symmachiella macrocystis]|uniref:ECF RNA polymerase sigma factor SigE n=1 Tax=Symmachiella macrocystis TaxID=2527985 RepID=A0A5C6BLD1_9PLAN|nr:sigma-70 family RNA polymerase sigma factor [Symmachiella macrocystis]TWU12920.1 ECF RNA polymerase sigma factor SigE [Symmachiella macrocystis]